MKGKGKSKPSMAKAKSMVAKSHKSKAKRNMDTFFYAGKFTVGVKPVQGVAVANYVYQPWALLDATAPWGITQIPEFKLYQSIYDKVRINSITVKWTPKANVLGMDAAQNDAALNVTGDGMLHTCIDRDGVAPSSITQIRKYSSYKGYSVLKKGTRKYAIRYPTGVWLDTANIYSDNTLLQRLGLFGTVTFYAENLLEDNAEIFNEPWANVELTYNCVFQGKTSANVSYDASGVVTVSPHQLTANLAVSDYILPGIDKVDNAGTLTRGNTTQG